MTHAKVAVVILNWNGKRFLEKFLPNVLKNSESHDVIVADNASTDDSVNFIQENFSNVKVVVNKSNGGFAKGYNDALKQVQADYYILLNSDVEVSPNWIESMLEVMESDEAVVAVQPKVLAHHNKSVFEHAGASGGYIDKNYYPFCRGRIFGDVEEDNGQYDGNREVFWTTGACMLIKAKAYHQVNGLDEDFFAHMEEIDMCWRLKRKGYKLMVAPKSVVYHVGGGTLNYESPNKTYLNFRNSLFMIHKNHEGILPLFIFKRLILDGLAAAQFLTKFKVKHIGAILKAHFHYYQAIPSLNKKRKSLKFDNDNFTMNYGAFYSGSILYAKFFKGINHFSRLNQRLFK